MRFFSFLRRKPGWLHPEHLQHDKESEMAEALRNLDAATNRILAAVAANDAAVQARADKINAAATDLEATNATLTGGNATDQGGTSQA